MIRRIFFLFILLPLFATAQNGSTVYPMPGFFNPMQLRFKNCITTDYSGRVLIGMEHIGMLIWDGSAWSYYDSNSGLSSNSIKQIVANPAGQIWAGTDTGGVCFFDGLNWINYSSWNSPLPSPRIRSLQLNGTDVWIGTDRGLVQYDGSNWSLFNTQNSALPSDTVNDIAVAPNGELLIGTERGLIHYNGTVWSGYWYHPAHFPVEEVYVHSDGTEWIIMMGSVYRKNNTGYSVLDLDYDMPWANLNGNAVSLGKGPGGGVAFCSNRGSLHEIVNDRFQTYYPYGMVVNNTLSNGCFSLSQNGNEFWFINLMTTSLNAPLNALMKFDPAQYNGLGLGVTGSNVKVLNVNEVSAMMLDRGDMFWDLSAAYYRVPKSTGASSIFAGAIWIGGLDTGGVLHQAAMSYRQRGEDYFPGPLDPQTGQTDSATAWKFDRIWKVDQYMISEFQWHFAQGNVQNGTYPVPLDIRDWPATGNMGITEPLAAFVDVNGNGIYDPLTGGDYPQIRGDQELFSVFNDQLAAHGESGGIPLGVEVQRHAYAYTCNAAPDSTRAINYTTFYSYEIINRSAAYYTGLQIGSWIETDLGNWQDDFTGCNPQLNAGFVYNGDAYDDLIPPYPSYLNYPPVQSAVVLDGPEAPPGDSIDNDHDGTIDEAGEKILLSVFGGFRWLGTNYPTAFPADDYDFYGYMNSQWQDSSAITYGGDGHTGTQPVNFMYPDIPSDTSGWNEFSAGNIPNDRSFLISTGKVDFAPGDTIRYTIALVTSFDSLNAWNTPAYYQTAFDDIQQVRQWYAAGSYPSCMPLFDAVPEWNATVPQSILLYPNPASDQLTIEYKAVSPDASIHVYDISGKNLFSGKWNSDRLTIPVQDYVPGFYFVQLVDGNQTVNAKFVRCGN